MTDLEQKQNLKRLRKERGWSQEELGDKAGLSRVTVNRLESLPGYTPSGESLQKLAEAFELPWGTFVGTLHGGSFVHMVGAGWADAERRIQRAGAEAQHREIDEIIEEYGGMIGQKVFGSMHYQVTLSGYVTIEEVNNGAEPETHWPEKGWEGGKKA